MKLLWLPFLAALLSLQGCSKKEGSSLSDAPEVTLKVLTYNAYLLKADPNGAASIASRLAHLPDALVATGADIIIMQEVWGNDIRSGLARAMADRGYAGAANSTPSFWPPYHYGNGLYIFVKEPLRLSGTTRKVMYPSSSLLNLDAFTTKGAIGVTVEVPGAGTVDVFSAHTSYLPFKDESDDFDRSMEPKLLAQVKTIVDFVNASSARHKILGLDLNTHPDEWIPSERRYDPEVRSAPFRALTEGASLSDALGDPAMRDCGECYTWNGDENALIKQGIFNGIPGDTVEPNGRIDHVLVSDGIRVGRGSLALTEARDLDVVVNGRRETRALPLSDHFGVLTEIHLPGE